MKHEALRNERLILGALINSLRFLVGNGASPDLAERAARRWKELQRELDGLAEPANEQPALIDGDEMAMAVNFSRQPRPTTEAGGA